jgi:homoserine O-acetyltransferase/O-succinyltransferase
MTKTFKFNEQFVLESGKSIEGLELCYTMLGNLHENAKVVWVFHALTASSNPLQWWSGLVGDGKLFNDKNYCIICVNLPGSCYGSTGPLSINPQTSTPYYHNFPTFSVKDIVCAFDVLRKKLNINKIHVGIGASMGGQHLLQWAIDMPELFEHLIPIATNAQQSPWSLAIDTAQRLAIEADVTWKTDTEQAGVHGMKAARAMAMIQYRTYDSFSQKSSTEEGTAETYQKYHSEKLADRFNAYSYYTMSLSRATYNVGKYYQDDVKAALARITARTLVIGITTDQLFPIQEQKYLAANIKNASLFTMDSIYGHDAFLVEYPPLEKGISHFLHDVNYYL